MHAGRPRDALCKATLKPIKEGYFTPSIPDQYLSKSFQILSNREYGRADSRLFDLICMIE
jgi:hypothetical protein